MLEDLSHYNVTSDISIALLRPNIRLELSKMGKKGIVKASFSAFNPWSFNLCGSMTIIFYSLIATTNNLNDETIYVVLKSYWSDLEYWN